MEAIVLAGGFGTRLKQLVPHLPKPMALVAGRPFLEILLSSLERKGFRRVVLSLGYMAEKIVEYFGDHFNNVVLVYEIEKKPLGTGGAVRQALERCHSDHVYVFNGDTYLDLEVDQVESFWREHRAPLIVAREVSDTSRYGRLNVKEGRIIDFAEKKSSGPGLINSGSYVFPKHLFDDFSCGRKFSLETDFLSKRVRNEHFSFFVSKGFFIDIGFPEDLVRAQTALAGLGF